MDVTRDSGTKLGDRKERPYYRYRGIVLSDKGCLVGFGKRILYSVFYTEEIRFRVVPRGNGPNFGLPDFLEGTRRRDRTDVTQEKG